jgi:uncharacterized membrane protein HdeD (DUF308 family)
VLVISTGAKGRAELTGLLVEASTRIAAAILAFMMDRVLTNVLLAVLIAAWAIVSGLAEIYTAVTLRRELSREWPLPTIGIVSVVLGVFLMARASAGAPALPWLMSFYWIVSGWSLLALTARLEQLARDVGHRSLGA